MGNIQNIHFTTQNAMLVLHWCNLQLKKKSFSGDFADRWGGLISHPYFGVNSFLVMLGNY